jgi:adsorption protein B
VLLWTLERATHELALFAAIGILIGGIDDLVIDLIWLARAGWRRFAVYTRFPPADAASLTASRPGRIAVFVPAWQESAVIAPMLSTAVRRWDGADFRLYVGCYANDPATTAAVAPLAAADRRIRLVVNPRPGPTTKADNLNAMWAALLADELADGVRVKAVVLHDAEDVVHSAEIRVFDALSERFDLVQLPVLPLIEQGRGFWARAVSSTYADEFAESHMKQLVVREAVGAAMPSAGVGCAFSRAALMRIARLHGAPFDEASVTEDYELGLRIAEAGGRGVFVRLPGRAGGQAVAVRAHFPDAVATAVRQKARWLAGISLSGWRRLGWRGGLAERWMRLRDRRAVLAALIVLAAYLAMIGWALLALAGHAPQPAPGEAWLFAAGAALLGWRLAMRGWFVARAYGWREGLASIPRSVIANIIAIAASRAAINRYVREARGGPVIWDKTEHRFPTVQPAE